MYSNKNTDIVYKRIKIRGLKHAYDDDKSCTTLNVVHD